MSERSTRIELLTAMIKGIFSNDGIVLTEFPDSLENVFCHGDVFVDAGYVVDDSDLKLIFDGIKTTRKGLLRIEKRTHAKQ
jgi:hypothetical protein